MVHFFSITVFTDRFSGTGQSVQEKEKISYAEIILSNDDVGAFTIGTI